MTVAPGWFPDPGTGTYLRWWDGNQWTPYTQPFLAPAPHAAAVAPAAPQPVVQPPAKEGWWARQTARNAESRRLQQGLGISAWDVAKLQVEAKQAERSGKQVELRTQPVPQAAPKPPKPVVRQASGTVTPDRLRVVTRWALDEQIEVAGETYHINEIKKVLKAAGVQVTKAGVTLDEVPTFLCPEPSNAYDRNAVMVMVGIYMIGYLPADIAVDYSPPLLELARQGEAVGCQSRIWARLEGGMARARVTLLAPEVDELP
jgi:hypothetical protein